MKKWVNCLLVMVTVLLALSAESLAGESLGANLRDLTDVQKYNRAIHIMAMLLVGFGFLMVFVKKYGRSAITATYLLVSVSIPLYFLKDSFFNMGGAESVIDQLDAESGDEKFFAAPLVKVAELEAE